MLEALSVEPKSSLQERQFFAENSVISNAGDFRFEVRDDVLISFRTTSRRRKSNEAFIMNPRCHYYFYLMDEFKVPEAFWMGGASLRQAVGIENYPFSTNDLSQMTVSKLDQMKSPLLREFPRQALWLRGLYREFHPKLIGYLREQGWRIFPAKPVYDFRTDSSDFTLKEAVKRDLKLMGKHSYRFDEHSLSWDARDWSRALELYRMVYIQKHSALNPDFRETAFSDLAALGSLEFCGIRDSSEQLVAIAAFRKHGSDFYSNPIIGYDTSLPQQLGCYRIMAAKIIERMKSQKVRFNFSSGVGEFKRRRGGVQEFEYHAVFDRHLPRLARQAFSTVNALSQTFMIPICRWKGF